MIRLWSVWTAAALLAWAKMQSFPRLDTAFETSAAYTELNRIREAAGLNTLAVNDTLARAALSHARYIVANKEPSHYEREGAPAFTGKTPQARAMAAGYATSMISENLSTRNQSAHDSIDGLFSAIYHRFGFLDPAIDEVGIGIAQEPKEPVYLNAFVYVMGNSAMNAVCRGPSYTGHGAYMYGFCKDKTKRVRRRDYLKAKNANAWLNPEVVVYPYAGQHDVYPVFYDETPDPLPDMDVSGFPVSVAFNPYFFSEAALESFRLYDEKGREVEGRLMDKNSDPHGRFNDLQFAFFPLKRLRYDTSYTARVVYRYKGKRGRLEWSFHTRVPDEPWFRIEGDRATVEMKGLRSAWLYFVPRHGHDRLQNVSHDSSLFVRFIDHNTLRIVLPEEGRKTFVVKAGERSVTVRP